MLLSTECEVDVCHVVASNVQDEGDQILTKKLQKNKSNLKDSHLPSIARMRRSQSDQNFNQKTIMQRSISEQPLMTKTNEILRKDTSMPPPDIGRTRTPSELNIDIPKTRTMRRKSSGISTAPKATKKPRVRSESSIENYFNKSY